GIFGGHFLSAIRQADHRALQLYPLLCEVGTAPLICRHSHPQRTPSEGLLFPLLDPLTRLLLHHAVGSAAGAYSGRRSISRSAGFGCECLQKMSLPKIQKSLFIAELWLPVAIWA